MSRDVLATLRDVHAFDCAPRYADLSALHVPFESLSPTPLESTVRAALLRPERVGLVGPSGCGKSSVAAYTTGPLVEGLAPIRLPVSSEPADIVADPRAFARHLVTTVLRYAEEAELADQSAQHGALHEVADARTVGASARSRRIGLTPPPWLGAGAGLAYEVATTARSFDLARSAEEVTAAATTLLELIQSHGLMPVLVLDDTDAWLQIPGLPDRTELVAHFFGRTVRLLAELPAALVVAIHENYRVMPAFTAAEGFIEDLVVIPPLPTVDALAALLEHRVQLQVADAHLGDALGDDALDHLDLHYRSEGRRSLRDLLVVVHTAVAAACDADADVVTRSLIDAAIADWANPACSRRNTTGSTPGAVEG